MYGLLCIFLHFVPSVYMFYTGITVFFNCFAIKSVQFYKFEKFKNNLYTFYRS
jgi:hypothetical protein